VINYDGRTFRSADPETANGAGLGPIGHYHQNGERVWAEFAGGAVAKGALVGTCTPDGSLTLAYCQLLQDGQVVAGRCTSTPQVLNDGRIRLREQWWRFDHACSCGVSYIEEVALKDDG